MGEETLRSIPSDLELMRYASHWTGANNNWLRVAVELGLEGTEIEQIEHDHKDNLLHKTFYVFEKWLHKTGNQAIFKTLIDATKCDSHILCRILKDDDTKVNQSIPVGCLEEICSDEMIDQMSVFVSEDYIRFGLEIGLKLDDIKEVKSNTDAKGFFDWNRRMMRTARDNRPGGSMTVRCLSCALLRIGNKAAFDYLVDRFINEHEEEEDE